ncbi:MAG: glycosyltransferase family 4 protein, partial [Azospirillaceae bacterium]|nr:glycosyltransferase family 4 protein [Azospirillaceae bacterium]
AGSLVSTAVFRAGVRFDEDMRLGYEDWDFFLQAAGAGFRGRHCAGLTLKYRKRAESMLSDSSRDDAVIRSYLLRKHVRLFQPRNLVALEQREAPRYAIFLTDQSTVILTTDPAECTEQVSLAEFQLRCWRAWRDPSQFVAPPYMVFTHSSVLAVLGRSGLLHHMFASLEEQLEERSALVLGHLSAAKAPDMVALSKGPLSGYGHRNFSLAMMPLRLFQECVADPSPAWLESIKATNPQVPATVLEISLDLRREKVPLQNKGIQHLLSSFADFRASPYRSDSGDFKRWRQPGCGDRTKLYLKAREQIAPGAVAFPRVVDNGTGARKNIGFLLSVLSFGGVEKVTLRLMEVLKAQGWGVHVILVGASEALLTSEWRAAIDSVAFLPEGHANVGSEHAYTGTHLSAYREYPDQARALGRLHWLDAVVNCQSAAGNTIMARLRRLKVKTFAFPHVIDQTTMGRSVGHPYLVLPYEHAYDGVLTCSNALADWLAGMGVPRSKLVPIPNAPGYEPAAEQMRVALEKRAARGPAEPLRALFIGRLDRQKGVERLVEVVRLCEAEQLPVEWRIVGKSVLASESAEAALSSLKDKLEPPVSSAKDLTELYAWADVLVVLSHWEGLPLTILEAGNLECVPIATDVGAVREAVDHGRTGVLLAKAPVLECVAALRQLQPGPRPAATDGA